MPSLSETCVRVRAAHLLVRSAAEWDALSQGLFRAYDSKDSEMADRLRETFLAAWKSVTRNLLTDTRDAIGITVTPAAHPWGIATLEIAGRSCEPLLCSRRDLPEGLEAAAVCGGLHLRSFEEVMAGYDGCLTSLLWESRSDFTSAHLHQCQR